jgi:hypothetical protein
MGLRIPPGTVKLRNSIREPASIATDTRDRQALSQLVLHRCRSVVSSLLLGVCATSCVEDFSQRTPLLDTSVQFELVSHEEGDSLNVTDPTFTFAFNDYLDLRASALENAFSLRAGIHQPRVQPSWDAVRQTLRIRPLDPLRPGLVYTLAVDRELLRGLGSRPVESPIDEWEFRVDAVAQIGGELDLPTFTYAEHVRPVLVENCGCHWSPGTVLTPLDSATLRGRADQRSGRALVVPFDAGRSYLVEKILDDYPDRFGTQMPPPWADESPLSSEDLQQIHDWIAGGALD